MVRKYSMAFGLCVAFLVSGSARAAVDQSQLTFNTGDPFVFPGGPDNYPIGQSFTAGLSGLLSQIDVFSNGQLNGMNTVTMELRSGDGTGGTLLGSLSQDVGPNSYDAGLGGYPISIDTTSLGVNVTPGSTYTFLFTNVTGAGDLALRGILANDSDPYAGGQAYNGPAYGNTPTWDQMFQTHVVPEPASLALLAGAGLMVGLRRRRQRA